MQRRLPIYLLLDTSESMAGEALTEMGRGVETMIEVLRNDPQALETAFISLITFSNTAQQAVPLTELLDFRMPKLSVRTGTALGAGLRLLGQCMKREVRRTTQSVKGDYKPLVLLLSDGQPTDDYEEAAAELKSGRGPSIANIYAIGCGPDADLDSLRDVTDIVLQMKNMRPETWKSVFVWLSASVQSTSQALTSGGEGKAMSLPNLPADLEIAPRHSTGLHYGPRQVFLHARCNRDGRPYLMRFAKRPGGDVFVALCSHVLEVVESGGGGSSRSVNTDQLQGVPPCPYCENPVAIACPCGTLMCFNGDPRNPPRCPGCQQTGTLASGGGGFDVRQARG